MPVARLMLLFACLSLPMLGESIEWDCGGPFGGCGSTVAVDGSQTPTTYIAQNISVIVPIINMQDGQPNATDTFSLAFQVNVGNFSNIIDQTPTPNVNIGATISNIQVYPDPGGLFEGDTVLSFDTFYPQDVLPQAWQTYLGSATGVGYDLIDFKTTPTQEGGMDYTIDAAQVVIDPTPEPGTLALLGTTLALLGAFSGIRARRSSLGCSRP